MNRPLKNRIVIVRLTDKQQELLDREAQRHEQTRSEGIDKAKLKGVYKNNGGTRKEETLEEFSAKSSTKK